MQVRLRRVAKGDAIMRGAYASSCKAPHTGAEIAIADDGVGIPDENSEKVFDPFFTTKDSDSGSGFGLYNAKLYVEDHNGQIGYKSQPDKGTIFYIYLPLAEKESESDTDVTKQRQKSTRRSTRGLIPKQ